MGRFRLKPLLQTFAAKIHSLSGTDVGAGNGNLGLKSEANECRRSATKNLK